jgi:predicted transcriptional regulator
MAPVPDDHLSIRVDADLIRRLDALAKADDRTRSNMARRLLLKAIEAAEAGELK